MEEYLIFAAIGGLLLLTLFVNSVAEAYDQKQREKRIKILRIKQGLDELSDLLVRLKDCNIPDEMRNVLLNEIIARLQAIQNIDKNFRGIQALIDEANENAAQEPTVNDQAAFKIKDESDFKRKLVTLRRLIKKLGSTKWYSKVKPEKLQQFIIDAKLLRCEKVFQFYSDKAAAEVAQQNLLLAKESYYYILHSLKSSGISTNPRVVELKEQSDFMMEQVSDMMSKNIQDMVNENNSEQASQQQEQAADANEKGR